jgi:cell division protein FtsZ
MLENQEITVPPALRVKIIGVGGAGANALEHMTHSDLGQLPLAIVHTHARILQHHSIPNRLLLGLDRTHGIGSGGDAELARVMAESEAPQLAALSADADLVFILAGLGGGTGSGVTPVLAKAAKANGALVIAIVTTPFDFEGARRQKQAAHGLQAVRASADAVICIANEKMSGILDANTTIIEAFARTNDLLAQGVRGIWQMLTRPGLINVDFAYLHSVLRGRHTESLLAMAEASGENRARDVIQQLFNNPLIDGGELLADSDQVLVSLTGSRNLTISEINKVMEQLNRAIAGGQLIFGTAIDDTTPDKLSITLVASKKAKNSLATNSENTAESARSNPLLSPALDGSFLEDTATPRPAPRFIAPAPESTPEKTRELLVRQSSSRLRKGTSKWKQEMLALEIVSRGRFEKSEPTIHRGADLDVPTYIRRGIPLN